MREEEEASYAEEKSEYALLSKLMSLFRKAVGARCTKMNIHAHPGLPLFLPIWSIAAASKPENAPHNDVVPKKTDTLEGTSNNKQKS